MRRRDNIAIILACTLCCLTIVHTYAQSEVGESTTDSIEYQNFSPRETLASRYPYKQYITYAPSALLNTTPGLQFGYERLINNGWAVLAEVGGLYAITFDRKGVRIKAEIRNYFQSAPLVYLGAEAVHKYTTTNLTDWVDVGTHLRLIDYRGTRNLSYGCLKVGVNPPLGKERRLFLDIGFSLGAGKYSVDSIGIPEGSQVQDFNTNFLWDETFRTRSLTVPMAALSIKLKYGFG